MNKLAIAAFATIVSSAASAQTYCPQLQYGDVLTPGQWQQCFLLKQDNLGYTPVNRAGDAMQGPLSMYASTSGHAGFSLTPGVAPSAPVNGNMWMTSAGIYAYVNGSTIGPLAAVSGGNTWTGQQIDQGLTTTSPGWYTQITGDAFPRVRIGLNSTDIASVAFGPGNVARDTFIERVSAGYFRFGAPDAASPVAQTLSIQNVVAGTSNTAGAAFTFAGSQGTGTGAGGSILFKTAPVGSSGTTQNPLVTAQTVFGSGGVGLGSSATDPGAGNLNLGGGALQNNGTAPTGTGAYVRATSPAITTPTLPGLSTGTCANGVGIDSGNNAIKTSCPGAITSIAPGTTTLSPSNNKYTIYDNSGVVGEAQPAVLASSAGASPTGTSSGTGVMQGLGSACRLTPNMSTRIEVSFYMTGASTSSGGQTLVTFRYGTGGNPSTGASPTGTVVGAQQSATSASANYGVPIAMSNIITGLTPGTAYWFDIQLTAGTAGTASIANVVCSAKELF